MRKTLHVIGTLDVGGIEKWLVNLINHEKANKNQLDFQLYSMDSDPNKTKIIDMLMIDETNVIRSISNNQLIRSIHFFYTLIKLRPDVVHTHCGYSSGINAFIARLCGVRKIFVHSHSDRRKIDSNINVVKRFYIYIMKVLIDKFSDYRVGVSEKASKSLFLGDHEVVYCGVPSVFNKNIKLDELDELKRHNKFLVFHMGRVSEAKNYPFLFEIASETTVKDIHYVFIGDLIEDLYYQKATNNRKNITFLGFLSDPMSVIYKYADLFIMPSLWEGLPLSAIEAQKSSVRVLLSETITKDSDIGGVEFLPLELEAWKKKIVECSESLEKFEIDEDKFSLDNNLSYFKKLYSKLD